MREEHTLTYSILLNRGARKTVAIRYHAFFMKRNTRLRRLSWAIFAWSMWHVGERANAAPPEHERSKSAASSLLSEAKLAVLRRVIAIHLVAIHPKLLVVHVRLLVHRRTRAGRSGHPIGGHHHPDQRARRAALPPIRCAVKVGGGGGGGGGVARCGRSTRAT